MAALSYFDFSDFNSTQLMDNACGAALIASWSSPALTRPTARHRDAAPPNYENRAIYASINPADSTAASYLVTFSTENPEFEAPDGFCHSRLSTMAHPDGTHARAGILVVNTGA